MNSLRISFVASILFSFSHSAHAQALEVDPKVVSQCDLQANKGVSDYSYTCQLMYGAVIDRQTSTVYQCAGGLQLHYDLQGNKLPTSKVGMNCSAVATPFNAGGQYDFAADRPASDPANRSQPYSAYLIASQTNKQLALCFANVQPSGNGLPGSHNEDMCGVTSIP